MPLLASFPPSFFDYILQAIKAAWDEATIAVNTIRDVVLVWI